jgi:hypothetical protein
MKRYHPSKLSGALVLAFFLFASSCSKEYFDINDNPNSPSKASIKELLPSAEAAIALAMGADFQIYGGLWGQVWTQNPASSQYKTFEQYSPSSSDFDRSWKLLYADALEDLVTIEAEAKEGGYVNYVAVSKILQAYAFQTLTDNFGDIPFSQALNGEVLFPAYDRQEDVYTGVIKLLKDADALIDESAFAPGTEDLLLHGDMSGWRKFGNTLLLRVYMRLSEVNPSLAQNGIGELSAAGAQFLGDGEDISLNYFSVGGNTNPLYSSIVDLGGTQNLVGSATCINYMLSTNDPRVEVLYTLASNGTYAGILQGGYDTAVNTPASLPSAITGGYGDDATSALAPVRLMTGVESLFMQAEAAQRGWLADAPQALYDAAINASFNALQIPDSAANFLAQPSIAFPAADSLKLKAIMTQKWVALSGTQNNEVWNDWRRTNYPDFFTVSLNSIIGAGRFPARFLYPNSEVTRNQSFPGQKLIYDRVWWDVN